MDLRLAALAILPALLLTVLQARADTPAKPPGMAELLAASTAEDWRDPDPEQTLYLDLAAGRVVIELAPQFAPNHVANIKTLVRAGYFDGLSILRVQENYVVQWGDPNAEDPKLKRSLGQAAEKLDGEYALDRSPDLPFAAARWRSLCGVLPASAPGFPVAGSGKRIWLAHCYGMVGAGRGDTSDSGNGAELYVVIGHAPRHLDRNVTLVGRVLSGMERLTTLERGKAALGFIDKKETMTPIQSIRLAADTPAKDRSALQVLRTDTPLFEQLVEARRTRREDWFLEPTGRIELCNVPIPVRQTP
ncbi:MAG: peptidylprolyl isomerase [Ahniella sp.]|nr:peptidylprolyl isomerase [Ahniella sp.]